MFEADMEITLERERASVRAHVRGWKDGGYILVDVPDARWKQKDENPLVARLASSGKYYGFTTRAIGFMPEINLLILEYPEDIVDTSLRTAERFTITLPVTMTMAVKDKRYDYPGLITDISKHGCRIACGRPFNVSERLALSGQFPQGDKFEKIMFTIISASGGEGKFFYGGQLTFPAKEDEKALVEFMKRVKIAYGP
ncbi:MAG: PilZ domain-containing protein [Nitrospinae bacterium]|nr:PilZ domain-containing protein [Nitrospinota bacterium]